MPVVHPIVSSISRPVARAVVNPFASKNRSLRLNLDNVLSEQTIIDRSPYGNNATLKSGVYFSTDGLADKGIGADCSAEGSGDYYYTARIRSSSTGTKYATIGGAAVSANLPVANVWTDVTFSTASSVTPSDCFVGWDGASNFSDCDWSEVKLWKVGVSDPVAYWPGCDSEAASLDGHFVADVSGNGYHGAHVGGSSGSGETDILQTAGLNANLWAESLDFENGENLEGTPPKLTDVSLDDRGGSSTTGVNYDAVADADGIGGANSGSYCLKVSTTGASLGMTFITPADDVTRTTELYYYVPTGQPNLELRMNNTMALAPTLLSGNLTTKDAWTKITLEWKVGTGNSGTTPWIGPAGGAGTCYFDDITITNPSVLVFADLSNPTNDATGRPLLWMRPNNKVINVLFDSSKAAIAADASMDATQTVYGWVYYDGTDGDFFDLGAPTIGATSGSLTTSNFTDLSPTHYVNGVATSTLGAAGWKFIAVVVDTDQDTDAIDLLRTCAALRFSDRVLTAAEIAALYDAEKSQYGL